MFPNAQFIADYDSLMNAIGYMPSICSDNVNKRITDDVEACKYELAAFLAKTFWYTMGNPEELETT